MSNFHRVLPPGQSALVVIVVRPGRLAQQLNEVHLPRCLSLLQRDTGSAFNTVPPNFAQNINHPMPVWASILLTLPPIGALRLKLVHGSSDDWCFL